MRKIEYVKVDTNKNTTILVLTKLDRLEYAHIAKQLMLPESVYAEQVGFIEPYVNYLSQGGNKDFANEFCQLLTLSKSNILTIHILRNLLNTVIEDDILDNLETVQNELINICNGIKIIIVPAMPKTWEAYTTYMFDVRVCGYNKAIAGGGSLKINPTEEMNFHSGAGIGVTRIAEHLIATEIDLDIQ